MAESKKISNQDKIKVLGILHAHRIKKDKQRQELIEQTIQNIMSIRGVTQQEAEIILNKPI